MSRILIAILIFSFSAAAQFRDKNSVYSKKKVQSEVFTFLVSDSLYKAYHLFKVPYSSLLFEKQNSKFISKLEIALEIKNSQEQIVERRFWKDTIELDEFEKTISDNHFISNLIEFELTPDTFNCSFTYNDLITGKPFEMLNQKIDLVRTKDSPRWLLIKQNESNLSNSFKIDFFGNVIPYSPNKYDLLVVDNLDFSKVEKVNIKSEDTVLTNFEFVPYNSVFPKFQSQNDRLILELIPNKSDSDKLESDSQIKTNFLIIKNINESLFEGKYSIELFGNNEVLIKAFPISVSWIDKPKSLIDLNFALELIEYIEANESFRLYFSSDTEKKNKLFTYWKQKDPTPSTSFNELMNEFYLRADYAQKEFISISQRNGAKTDRGKVFILNGKPERIERSVNSDGKIIESWYYEEPKRVFTFIDYRGDGSFKSLK